MPHKEKTAHLRSTAVVVPSSHIHSVKVSHFTLFEEMKLQFSPHINVILGENGTGKTQLMKLLYSLVMSSVEASRKYMHAEPTKQSLQAELAEKLLNVFRAESLGHLVSFDSPSSGNYRKKQAEVEVGFFDESFNYAFNLKSGSRTSVGVHGLPQKWLRQPPVYLTTRELLSIYPNFVSLYESRFLEFEETYRDMCLLLGLPLLKNIDKSFADLLSELEAVMGGKIILQKNGRFYLKTPHGKVLEIPLVAEGLRKLGMVAQFLANGSFQNDVSIFWDEPETNLNPKLIKQAARIILALGAQGKQVFVATHSLFLMREIEILLKQRNSDVYLRVLGLAKQDGQVVVEQANNFDAIQTVVALDEELEQSDRFMEADDAWWSEQNTSDLGNQGDGK